MKETNGKRDKEKGGERRGRKKKDIGWEAQRRQENKGAIREEKTGKQKESETRGNKKGMK